MSFEIAGQICEKETGKALSGLVVQIRCKDISLDGCLGGAITDPHGEFRLIYPEEGFEEVFKKQPEIFLTIQDPSQKPLTTTRKKVRWGSAARARITVAISGKKVGDASSGRLVSQVQGGVSLSPRRLRIDTVDGFHVPRFPEFGNGTPYGSPSILEQSQYVVIPAGAKVSSLEVDPGPMVRKGRKIRPLPVQPPILDLPDEDWDATGFDSGFVALDPLYSLSGRPYPEHLVQMGRAEEWEGMQRIRVKVRPLQYDPASQGYLFYPKLRYTIHFTPPSDSESTARRAREADRSSHFVSRQLLEFLDRKDVSWYSGALADRYAESYSLSDARWRWLKTPYLIITDDNEWSPTKPGKSEPPEAPLQAVEGRGSMVAQFRRLAKWKTQRGMRTAVVTVKEIIENKGGIYGDLKTRNHVAAIDLQEVIRNFIWWARKSMGVEYLLLGGDINIIPMRSLVGYITSQGSPDGWDCMRTNSDEILKDQCRVYEKHNIVKLHYVGKAPLAKPLPLLTHQGGKEIPYHTSPKGDQYPRWFFVHRDEFEGKMSGFTSYEPPVLTVLQELYVIVEDNGEHLSDICDDYYWVSDGRRIPTDRYYSCAASEKGIGDGVRDFDKNRNGFWGQFRWDEKTSNEVPIDGFNIMPDVYVGRAPVRKASEAMAFVDKVIAYEQLTKVGSSPKMRHDFLKRVVQAASDGSKFQLRAEEIRNRILELYPEFDDPQRFYGPTAPDEPGVTLLTNKKLHAALSEGCHFLTMNGHGRPWKCCTLRNRENFPNESGLYIAYANSCETASPDKERHSLGEAMVVQTGGGAVAYVGSARMDCDHLNHGYGEIFWERLFHHRRLGPAAADCDRDGGDFWHFYCRTLFGDPEMPVWVKEPRRYTVSWPPTATRGEEIVVRVQEFQRLKVLHDESVYVPISSGASAMLRPLGGHLVTFMAGWDPLGTDHPDRQKAPELFTALKTGRNGEARLKIPRDLKADCIEITVCPCSYTEVSSKYGFQPVTHVLSLTA